MTTSIPQPDADLRALANKISFDPAYLAAFEKKLFIEGQGASRRLTNFFVLLLLATVIATFGLLSSSTATVIGAMIVAPLMGPIMATTAAIVMGQTRRVLRSLALVVVGVIAVIAFSWLLAVIAPAITISFSNNPELASRISPGIYALLTALGAGAAGAFITSREEIADSMGGVAIAISLVPPLCVVGIGLSQGNMAAAGGALLLFLTNFLAILLAGGITFMVNGLGRVAITSEQTRVRRNALIVVVIGTLLVLVPLTITGLGTIRGLQEDCAATAEIDAWAKGTTHRVVAVQVQGGEVLTTIEGQGDLPPLKPLANELAKTLGRPVVVTLRVVPAELSSSD